MSQGVAATVSHRYPGLDGLRGAAALSVFLGHVAAPGVGWLTFGLQDGIWVFFVLSGFLLQLPFARARSTGRPLALGSYLVRRAARIYPAYLLATVAISLLAGAGSYLADPVSVVLMLGSPIPVVWTLAIEVQFYLLLPVLNAFIARVAHDQARVVFILATILVASLLGRTIALAASLAAGVSDGAVMLNAPLHLWAFVPGMILAELFVSAPERLRRLPTAPTAALGLALVALGTRVHISPDVPSIAGTVLLMIVLLRLAPGRVTTGALAAAGAVSYSFYLWHVWVVDTVARPSSWAGVAVAFLGTAAIASLVYLVVERPIIRWASAWRRRDHRAPGAPGVPVAVRLE